ncbi:hypothetical protein MUP77_24070 [Candidatus Bathyarchaeota archaeon]|nr:hypothetical protein [Candidatus Bathyarchaeota archaeon]
MRVLEEMKSFYKRIPWIPFLLVGMLGGYVLSSIQPLFSDAIYFLIVLGVIIVIVLLSILKGDPKHRLRLRAFFLGASTVFIASAFHSFFSQIGPNHTIIITTSTFIGMYRSILLASTFSFLERLTKFLEDQNETDRQQGK